MPGFSGTGYWPMIVIFLVITLVLVLWAKDRSFLAAQHFSLVSRGKVVSVPEQKGEFPEGRMSPFPAFVLGLRN